MNPRERMLAIAVLTLVMLGGGAFLFYELYLSPLHTRQEQLRIAELEVGTRKFRIQKVVNEWPKVLQAQALSLPSEVVRSERDYQRHLNKLLEESGISPGTFYVSVGTTGVVMRGTRFVNNTLSDNKKPPLLTPLTFTVSGKTDLAHLVDLLEHFYRTPLLHRIKNLSVKRPPNPGGTATKSTELDINLTVEAAIVRGAEDRATILPFVDRRLLWLDALTKLLRGPAGLANVPWIVSPTGPAGLPNVPEPPGGYAAIAAKNIFYGPPPPPPAKAPETDIAASVRLVIISDDNDNGCEAVLYNSKDSNWTKLCPKSGKITFQYKNEAGELCVEGTVVRINHQDVVFRAADLLYSIALDQTLADALRKPLSPAQVQAMKLAHLPMNGGAQ
jgi:hypothetical protein